MITAAFSARTSTARIQISCVLVVIKANLDRVFAHDVNKIPAHVTSSLVQHVDSPCTDRGHGVAYTQLILNSPVSNACKRVRVHAHMRACMNHVSLVSLDTVPHSGRILRVSKFSSSPSSPPPPVHHRPTRPALRTTILTLPPTRFLPIRPFTRRVVALIWGEVALVGAFAEHHSGRRVQREQLRTGSFVHASLPSPERHTLPAPFFVCSTPDSAPSVREVHLRQLNQARTSIIHLSFQ
jgi:hypothetical protein